ncbi:MAG: helix-turn-helix domain-containing protein [Myxococcota bacterium]
MPRPRTISDEDILVVARRCFAEHGHSVPTRTISKEVGISQAVLYQRFGGKKQMFLRAMMPPPPDIDELLKRPDGLSAREYLRFLAGRLVSHFQNLIPAVLHLVTYPGFDISLIGGAHEHLLAGKLHVELARRFRQLMETGEIENHPPEAMTAMFIGFTHTAGMQSVMRGRAHKEELQVSDGELDAIVAVIWQGLKPLAVD